MELLLLVGSILFFISMLVGKAGTRYGVPVLLLFLVVGMVFGSDGFGLVFENVQVARYWFSLFDNDTILCGLDTSILKLSQLWP